MLSSWTMFLAGSTPPLKTISSTIYLEKTGYYGDSTQLSSSSLPLVSLLLHWVCARTNLSTAKRLPYSDHIIALDAKGKICEQGAFDILNSAAGYVSSFTLPAPDWTYKPDPDSAEKRVAVKEETNGLRSNEALEAEANRRTGDVKIYLYYVGSVGWVAALIFVVFICGFVFCMAYPCKYYPDLYAIDAGIVADIVTTSTLAQRMGGSKSTGPVGQIAILPGYLCYAGRIGNSVSGC